MTAAGTRQVAGALIDQLALPGPAEEALGRVPQCPSEKVSAAVRLGYDWRMHASALVFCVAFFVPLSPLSFFLPLLPAPHGVASSSSFGQLILFLLLLFLFSAFLFAYGSLKTILAIGSLSVFLAFTFP